MNIVFIVNQPYPFGMAGTMRIKLFDEYLAGKNNDIKILISNQDNGSNKRAGSHNGVNYSTMTSTKFPSYFFYVIYPLVTLYQLLLTKKKNDINIIVIYGGINLFTLQFMLFGKLIGYKVVLDIVEDRILTDENLSVATKANLWISEAITPYLGKVVDGIIAISFHLLEKYKSLFSNAFIELIPVSAANIDLDYNNADRDRNNKIINILYAGSYGHKDGINYLLDAFNKVSKHRSDIRLILIGKAKSSINEKLRKYDNIQIIFKGYLSDEEYWHELYSADIMCMTRIDTPFSNAGFPFKLGEYLATGNSVIATDVSDIGFYLEDKKDFVMAEPSNVASLVSALEYLINHPEKRSTIGVHGYHKCKKYFNPKINSQVLLDFLNKLE